MVDGKDVGKIVKIRDYQGEVIGRGMIVTYTDKPTCRVNTINGEQINWHAEVIEEITDKDELIEMLKEMFDKTLYRGNNG